MLRRMPRRRNEIIADILSRAHYGERKRREIALIKETEPTAKFEQVGDVFISTFYRPTYAIIQRLVGGGVG